MLRHSYWVEGFNLRHLQIRAERLASQMNDEAVWELVSLISYSR